MCDTLALSADQQLTEAHPLRPPTGAQAAVHGLTRTEFTGRQRSSRRKRWSWRVYYRTPARGARTERANRLPQ